MNKKKISCALLTVILVTTIAFPMTGCSQTTKTSQSQVVINNEDTSKTVKTQVEDDTVYVSFKEACEYIGGKCEVNGKEAIATVGEDTIKVNGDSKDAEFNSKKIEMTKEAKIIKDGIYVPISFLNEVFNARVTFDKENKVLNIRTEMPLKYAKNFSVKYLRNGIKKVTDAEKRVLILVPEGKEVPEEFKNEIVINTPIKDVLLGSTTEACLLRPINELGSIKAVTTKEENWQIPEVKQGLKDGKITYVGSSKNPDYEKIASIKPQMAFVYTGPSGEQSMIEKFKELNINYAVNNEYLEENPFGRMEWMKFMAAFYNKEEEAEKYFNESVKKVEEASEKLPKDNKPTVAWGLISKGQVFAPKADSYVAKMIELAGGDYVFKEPGTGNAKIGLEDFYAQAKDASLFMYASSTTYAPTLKSVLEKGPALENLKAVKDKNTWCFAPDYYQSIDKTDDLIIQLMEIIHPKDGETEKITHYVKYE